MDEETILPQCNVCLEASNLVLCLDCDSYLCNNNNGVSSHIITHCMKKKHKQISIKERIQCSLCSDTNLFRLGINLQNQFLCRSCSKEDWKYLINEKCLINEIIESVQINKDKINLTSEDYSSIKKVPVTFTDTKEYQETFSVLLEEEACEERKLKESFKEDNLECFVDGGFVKFYEKPDSEIKINKGDEVIFEKEDYVFNGYVVIKKNELVVVKLKRDSQTICNSLFNRKKLTDVTLKFVWKEVNYSRMNYALENIKKYCSKNLLKTILHGVKENHREMEVNFDLNSSQKLAVQAALSRTLTLIQGPPGTGKTRTSACIVKSLVEQGHKVMVVAPSNIAVDQLSLEISKLNVKILRVLSRNREGTESLVDEICLHSKIKNFLKNESQNGGEVKNVNYDDLDDDTFYNIGKGIIQSADVIACTCITAGSPIFKGMRFSAVLIDEAVQATEPMSLIPLLYRCNKLILVGDHKQLGPLTISKKAKYGKLDQSLFERLVKVGIVPYLLTTQYRMHPLLIEFPNKTFYNNLIDSGVTISSRISFMNPSFFYCSFTKEELSSSGTSFLNKGEAMAAKDMIKYLNKNGVQNRQIGIITFYEGQRCFLSEFIKEVEITNVDGFQGREKDFIILSLVRSNESQGIGFISDKRRVNVALTRAKYGLIIIGNPLTIRKNALWNDMLNIYDKKNILYEGKIGSFKRFTLSTGLFDFKSLADELDGI